MEEGIVGLSGMTVWGKQKKIRRKKRKKLKDLKNG